MADASITGLEDAPEPLVGEWYLPIAQQGLRSRRILYTDLISASSSWAAITGTPTTLAGYGIADAVPAARTLTAGAQLTGGGDLSANRTIALVTTAVTAAAYGSASSVATFTVNAYGQLTLAASVPIAIASGAVSGLAASATVNALDASNITAIYAEANATALSVQQFYRNLPVTPYGFGAAGDGVADDTVPLNRFFAAVAAGHPGFIPAGTFNFTAALAAVIGSNISVTGCGERSLLRYTGAGTTATFLTFGDGSTVYRYLRVGGFKIDSSTTMTAGYAVRIRATTEIEFDLIIGDESTYKLYSGTFFDGSSVINLHASRFCVLSIAVTGAACVELHCNHAFIRGKPVAGQGTGIGIYAGGGCGGFYSEDLTQLLNNFGLLVDTALTGTGNTQFFLDGGTFDTNQSAAAYFNDAISNPVGKSISAGGWFASTTVGSGFVVAAWADGAVEFSGVSKNHAGNGIVLNDATAVVTIADDADISYNDLYGVDASAPITIRCNAIPRNNTSGLFGANVTAIASLPNSGVTAASYGSSTSIPTLAINAKGQVTAASGNAVVAPAGTLSGATLAANVLASSLTSLGTLAALNVAGVSTLTRDPTLDWLIKGHNNTISIANGGNAALAAGSGIILVTNPANGAVAVYIAGGGTVVLVATTSAGAWEAPTTTPGAGSASVQFDGASAYRLYNNHGSTQAFFVVLIMSRNSV